MLRGEYDAGAVKEIVARKYENLLTFLHISDPIPTVPFGALPYTPAALIDHIRDRLLALDPGEPSDRELMKTWDEEFRYGFITADDGDYDSVRRILDAPKNRCQSLP